MWVWVEMIRRKALWAGLYSQKLLSLGRAHPAKLHWPGLAGPPAVDTESKSVRHTSPENLSRWPPV